MVRIYCAGAGAATVRSRGERAPAIKIPTVALTITAIAARRSKAFASHAKIGGLQTNPE
jgi:hypothetical protein